MSSSDVVILDADDDADMVIELAVGDVTSCVASRWRFRTSQIAVGGLTV